MPYIKENKRLVYTHGINLLTKRLIDNTEGGWENNGDTVYVIYAILKHVYGKGNFEVKSNALKVLESAKLEYYRRIMSPYEDEKRRINGDI